MRHRLLLGEARGVRRQDLYIDGHLRALYGRPSIGPACARECSARGGVDGHAKQRLARRVHAGRDAPRSKAASALLVLSLFLCNMSERGEQGVKLCTIL